MRIFRLSFMQTAIRAPMVSPVFRRFILFCIEIALAIEG